MRLGAPILLVLLAATLPGQRRAPIPVGLVHADRIEVKLHESSGAVLAEDGTLGSRAGVDVTRTARLFGEAVAVERVVALPLELLDRWYREADERLPEGARRPGHLGLWFRLRCADAAAARRLLGALLEDPLVEDAYLEAIPVPCGPAPAAALPDDIPPTTPDLTAHQTWLADAPTGFGFTATRGILGARGEDVTIYHVELDWQWDHEDLGLGPANFLGNPSPTTTPGAGHGTAVVGILSSLQNGYGLTGCVDRANLKLVSALEFGGIAGSVAEVIAVGRPGDVVTVIGGLNLQMTKPQDVVPFEYLSGNFDVFLTATTQGLIVMTSAGNGDNDLDDPRFARRFDLSVRDSGSIMMGATDGSDPWRADFSNYGSRIDCNGWGYDVVTLGFGQLFWVPNDPRQAYTDEAAGTSSATALLTGVVARLSSVAQRQLDRVLTPLEVRTLLRTHGTPIPGHIGRRADMVALLDALGLPDGLALDKSGVRRNESITATMVGPAGGTCALALAPTTGTFPLGLNRDLHLDPSGLIAIGGFALPSGSATWTATIPNLASLADTHLYLQGVLVDPVGGGLHVTSSCGFWVR